ncbi:hypothetical protein ABZ606_30515 [Streptomyces sp. NPDC012461]|uniref:Chromosome segregation ATPase n=2 Tax=unclassified Streptomyces TaxID=2593676 RepID=A0A6G3R0X4_9ACTN|nr:MULTISPECIES: hypothetical protein [unclassified Streptomyces]NEA89403.1 hypothetical protein [Streptomyces sp. SID14436]NEC81625.1 hypothetical protein [Streptomyces sp. SID7958]
MYELNRIRLYNIGPTGARYGDVLLDLSEGGSPIPVSTLIPAAGQLFRRPAPATLLVLENGGGKSVLIRMLLSTVLPERQSRKGREALRAYVVSAAAPSHVVLEWVHARTGETLVTGQVLTPATDGTVERTFYSLSPNAETTLATLPFAESGRRLRMNAYQDALRRLDSGDKTLRLEIEKRQGEWEKHLRRLGLEPDLFAVQQAMNVDEGDAAEAFKTTTGRQFTQWLLSKAVDAEDFTELGDAFGAYAKNIGRREQLLLDRDFSTATATAAEHLARRRIEQRTAAEQAHLAAKALAQLAAQVGTSVEQADEALRALREDSAMAKENAAQQQQTRDKADLLHKEVRRQALVLRRDAAHSQAVQAEGQLAKERSELAAWAVVPTVLKAATAHEKYRVASELLDDAELAAGAARLRRDQAGARFAGALHHSRQQCAEKADRLDRKSAHSKTEAADAQRGAAEGEEQATARTVRAELLGQHVERVDSRLAQARQAGLIAEDESVAEADARLRARATDSKIQATREREEYRRLEQETRRLDEVANQLIEPEVKARQARETAIRAVEDTQRAAAELAAQKLLRELAELDNDEDVPGGDPAQWLEDNASWLRNLAAAAQASAGQQLDALRADDRADQRLIEALTVEDEALMPPRQAVEDLLELLAEHRITATAGWRALEQLVNPRLHAASIQAHPALVDGIVVPDQETLQRARTLLTQMPQLPAAAVLVSTREPLEAEPPQPSNGFVVEPTPALHDSQAAGQLREQAAARIEERRRALNECAERQAAAFQLEVQLTHWLRDHPAGHIEQLRSFANTQSAAATDAKAALDSARDACLQAANILAAHTTTVQDAEQAALETARTADSFQLLAQEAADADTNRAEIETLQTEAAAHHTAAQELSEAADRLRDQATEYAVQAESLRRDAAAYAARLDKVVYGDQPLTLNPGQHDVAALEIAYHQAAEGFRAVEVGEDLRQRVEEAQKETTDRDAELRSEPAEIVTRAKALAASAEAGSAETIEATKRRLGRTVRSLEVQYRNLSKHSGQLEADATRAGQPSGKPWSSLDADWTPSNPAEGAQLTERAASALQDAEALLKTAAETQRATERKLRTSEAAAREMTVVHRSLTTATRRLELPPSAAPFTGTADEAQQTADEAIQTHSTTTEQLHEADQAVNEAVAQFREAANQNRFANLKAPIYQQLTEIDTTSLIERAGQWTIQLTGRAASLTTDLEDSERHRNLLIDQLKHHTNQALALLEKAERLSRLPEGAGAWAKQRILKIGFSTPEPQILAVRIAETLDENARTQPHLPGRDLVLRCVGAAVPRDFKVEILKPDAAGRAEYASISDMSKVFSGGQELTGAIMLYCTLAALRASTRTGARATNRLGGMLVLDNPIGKANADYLLSLQMNMASALGVQLIYTTGNMEDRVLATFPLCIRLRNDTDQRTGTRHLHVTDHIAHETTPDEDGATGQVHAARLLVKPRASHAPLENSDAWQENHHDQMATDQ